MKAMEMKWNDEMGAVGCDGNTSTAFPQWRLSFCRPSPTSSRTRSPPLWPASRTDMSPALFVVVEGRGEADLPCLPLLDALPCCLLAIAISRFDWIGFKRPAADRTYVASNAGAMAACVAERMPKHAGRRAREAARGWRMRKVARVSAAPTWRVRVPARGCPSPPAATSAVRRRRS